MGKILMTVPEFLDEYSTSRTTMYREVAAGRLQIIKRGTSSLIAREDADDWVETLRANSPQRRIAQPDEIHGGGDATK